MSAPVFDGFSREAFEWFAGLEADNSKRWFAAHRETYEQAVRGPLEAFLDQLAGELGGTVKLFRQHRDTRFSADKSPYKTTTYGLIAERSGSLAALYAQLSATGLFTGTGYHVLAADQLARFRDAIADDATGPALEDAIARARAAGVETFGALKTAPRGYPRDHPRVQLLRHRSLVAGLRLDAGGGGAIARDAALGHARTTGAACGAMNAWLDAHVGASELPPQPRYGRAGR